MLVHEYIRLSFYAACLKRGGFSSLIIGAFSIHDPSNAVISFSHSFKGNAKEFSQCKNKMKAGDTFAITDLLD